MVKIHTDFSSNSVILDGKSWHPVNFPFLMALGESYSEKKKILDKQGKIDHIQIYQTFNLLKLKKE